MMIHSVLVFSFLSHYDDAALWSVVVHAVIFTLLSS